MRRESQSAEPAEEQSSVQSAATGQGSFAEVALRLGGASDDEAKRTGVIDSADDQVDALFSDSYRTVNSPIHRAVWDDFVPTELFQAAGKSAARPEVAAVVSRSIELVRTRKQNGTLYDDQDKIHPDLIAALGDAGYWGMLVAPEYGGSGASMVEFADMITQMAMIEPTVAGLASVHGCIGAVDPVRAFGDARQKQKFLPGLADGRRLSGFALTEPGAGSDLTALKTTAVRDGDHYVVNGEKLFITNATFGRTIGLVCRIDDQPAVLVVELPESETDSFRVNSYGLYALRRAHNNGLVFRDFRVPIENRLVPHRGDGLTIAYHGLNLGRVALCANAAGAMRMMLSDMLPWADYRETYGQPIAKRELVRRRVGLLAGAIVSSDALTRWCAGLLDQGYRGEMECIIAKVFGSEAQKEAAIDLFMKTHGGRSFLHGHLFGDNIHDFLAPCIYEGEGEMLSMAFFKSLVKQHGQSYFEPIGRILNEFGVSKPNLTNPRHWMALRKPMFEYARWYSRKTMRSSRWSQITPEHSSKRLRDHMATAQRELSGAGLEISGVMRRYQLKLADRQCRMSALSIRIQSAVTMLVTSLYGMAHPDPVTQMAADVACGELRRRIHGGHPTDEDYRLTTQLGEVIARDGWSELGPIDPGSILQPYK